MNRLEKLIAEIRKQLLPYRHEHDVERGCDRWEVGEEDSLTSWIAGQLASCRKKHGCAKRGLCAYYSYPDIATKNFEICREMLLLLENGEIECSFREKDPET
jgi:hypothetical protein